MKRKTPWKAAVIATASLVASIGGANAATFTAQSVSFRHITGAVEIVTTSGEDVDVTIRQGKSYHRVTLANVDGVLSIEGDPWRVDNDEDCCGPKILRSVNTRAGRRLSTGIPPDQEFFSDFPVITVSLPLDSDVSFEDARILLTMDRLAGALSISGCYVHGETQAVDEAVIDLIDGSRLVMGDIASRLEIDIAGDADFMSGDVATVDADIAGSGDVILGDVNGFMDVSIAGSGLLRATRIDGPLTARIAGSGAVAVKSGRADRLRAIIDGSGGVYFNGLAVQPDLRLSSSSEVQMQSVNGRITRKGRGAVYVGGELVSKTESSSRR
ncbi:MAG: GIN domain-containing protein [Hyphococcus sp.]